jgi:Zn-finger nucleic acid-binding protein
MPPPVKGIFISNLKPLSCTGEVIMNCPVCKGYALNVSKLEKGLVAHSCNKCGGSCIGSYHYWQWKDKTGKSLEEKPASDGVDLPSIDSTKAKTCPECDRFLRHFPVGHDIEFGLDRCGNCGGTWLDQNEWKMLKSRNLHDDIHQIFSHIWQAQAKDQEHQKVMDDFYKQKFGESDFEKFKEIKTWLGNHDLQSELKAFLKLG